MIDAGPGAGGRLRGYLAIFTIALLLTAGLVRPVRVAGDRGSTTIWLWAWQKGQVKFINSVTHLPVEMTFGVPWRFSGFHATTDPGTEEYYTSGAYTWNDRLAKEKSGELSYCSEVGMDITLGSHLFHEQGGCLSLVQLWPIAMNRAPSGGP